MGIGSLRASQRMHVTSATLSTPRVRRRPLKVKPWSGLHVALVSCCCCCFLLTASHSSVHGAAAGGGRGSVRVRPSLSSPSPLFHLSAVAAAVEPLFSPSQGLIGSHWIGPPALLLLPYPSSHLSNSHTIAAQKLPSSLLACSPLEHLSSRRALSNRHTPLLPPQPQPLPPPLLLLLRAPLPTILMRPRAP